MMGGGHKSMSDTFRHLKYLLFDHYLNFDKAKAFIFINVIFLIMLLISFAIFLGISFAN